MSADRYCRFLLTVIACALVYLAVAITRWPAVSAQSPRPGELTGPVEVVVVGWRTPQNQVIPVQSPLPVRVEVQNQVRVIGDVRTQQADRAVDRVVLTGWEEKGALRSFDSAQPKSGLPVLAAQR